MASKFARLPLSSFTGKFVKVAFPFFDAKNDRHSYVLQWVKVTGYWGNWLVGEMEGAAHLREDLKPGTVTHFLPESVEDMMSAIKR